MHKIQLTQHHYVSLFLVSTISYINTLFGGFVFDDSEAIVKNKDVMPYTSLADVFRNDFWGTEIALNLSHKSYRPLTILSYRINVYMASNKLNTFHLHATNILLFIFTSLLFYYCLKLFIKKNTAYYAAILFAVHPIHTEVVASLVGRADLLCSMCFLFSMIIYNLLLKQCSNSKATCLYMLNVFVIFCGVLCKETAITALGMCFILEILQYLNRSHFSLRKCLTKYCGTRFCGLIITFIGVMYFRLWIMAFEGPIFTKIDNAAAYSDNLFTKVFTYNYIYFINLLLLLWPQWLCFDWSMGCIPLIATTGDIRILFVLLFWLSISYTLFIFYKQYKQKNISNELLLGCSLMVLPFIPASNLFLKVGFVIAERTLFLPSGGFCVLIAHGYRKLAKNKTVSSKHFYFLCGILLAKTLIRNTEWLSEETLFTSALHVCPLNAKVHYNVAKVAADKHDRFLAVEEYQRALQLNPDYEQAMNNLANIFREDRRYKDAEELLRRAVQVRPNFAAAWMNLGIVLSSIENTSEAEQCYMMAIKYRPKYPDCYYNLGNLYLETKREIFALEAWSKAVYYRPTHIAAWSNTLVLLDSLGKYEEAVEKARKALMYNPAAAALHFNMANTLGKLQEFERAEKHFLEAINLNPRNALYYSNLGVLYHRWNKVDDAREMYRRALRIDPAMRTTANNLRKLIHTHGDANDID